MANYILQKDLPGVKAGAVFTLNGDFYHCYATYKGENESYSLISFQKDTVENNLEWFNKREEQKMVTEKKYSEEDMRKCFEAGYNLAAKHETNHPSSAMPFEDYLKTIK